MTPAEAPVEGGGRPSVFARRALGDAAGDDCRETRVLRSARELLLQRGYAHVTVEDISRRARIGKGTVYLHWESKAALVEEVLFAEAIGATTQLVESIWADPREILFHRVALQNFRHVLRRPLYRALYMRDADVLGRFLDEPAPILNEFRNRLAWAYQRWFAVLHEQGLVAADVKFDQAMVALDALCSGLVLRLQAFADVEPVAEIPESTEVLSLTVARAFGPLTIPSPAQLEAAAARITPVFDELLAAARAMLSTPLPAAVPPRVITPGVLGRSNHG